MQFSRSLKIIAVSSLLLAGACDPAMFNQQSKNTNTTPQVGQLTQSLSMVDQTGRVYGSVILDPINGGKVFDSEGRLIGRVVNPNPAPLAPALQ